MAQRAEPFFPGGVKARTVAALEDISSLCYATHTHTHTHPFILRPFLSF